MGLITNTQVLLPSGRGATWRKGAPFGLLLRSIFVSWVSFLRGCLKQSNKKGLLKQPLS